MPQRRPRSARRPDFIILWLIVSTLWTVGTGLRIRDVWLPAVGWTAVLHSVFTWIDLAVPPVLFGLVLWGIGRVAARSP